MDEQRTSSLALLIGPMAAIGTAGVLTPARSWFGASNIAMILVVVVVAVAALSDRRAAAVTSVAAALAFNFFHTKPYYTLRVSDRVDLTTVVLLLVVGLIVGELTVLRRRQADEAKARAADLRDLDDITELAARGDVERLLAGATATVRRELHLQDCRYEPIGSDSGSFVTMARNGSVDAVALRWNPDGFELPEDGVEIPVVRGDTRLGRLVLIPTAGVGVPLERRRLAVAVADVLAVAHGTVTDRTF